MPNSPSTHKERLELKLQEITGLKKRMESTHSDLIKSLTKVLTDATKKECNPEPNKGLFSKGIASICRKANRAKTTVELFTGYEDYAKYLSNIQAIATNLNIDNYIAYHSALIPISLKVPILIDSMAEIASNPSSDKVADIIKLANEIDKYFKQMTYILKTEVQCKHASSYQWLWANMVSRSYAAKSLLLLCRMATPIVREEVNAQMRRDFTEFQATQIAQAYLDACDESLSIDANNTKAENIQNCTTIEELVPNITAKASTHQNTRLISRNDRKNKFLNSKKSFGKATIAALREAKSLLGSSIANIVPAEYAKYLNNTQNNNTQSMWRQDNGSINGSVNGSVSEENNGFYQENVV